MYWSKILAIMAVMIVITAAASWANPDFWVGITLNNFIPINSEMYGGKLIHTEWGKQIEGLSWSQGPSRVQYYGVNRYNYMLSPKLTQAISFDMGLILELSESFTWMMFAPNSEVDIIYQRLMIPLLLTPKYEFKLAGGKVRPYIGAGGGVYFVNTHISGKDLYDKKPNPKYVEQANSDTNKGNNEPEYIFKTHKFGTERWVPGCQGVVGVNLRATPQLYVNLGVNWSYIPVTDVYAQLNKINQNTWNWESKRKNGDAGGPSLDIGVNYSF